MLKKQFEIRLTYAVGRRVPRLMAWNRGAKIEVLMERNLAVSSFKDKETI